MHLPSTSLLTPGATTVGLRRLADPDVRQLAVPAGRLLFSHDFSQDHRTVPQHFARFITQTESPGLLIVPQSVPIAAVAADLVLIATVTDGAEWINRVAYLPI